MIPNASALLRKPRTLRIEAISIKLNNIRLLRCKKRSLPTARQARNNVTYFVYSSGMFTNNHFKYFKMN